MLVTDKYTGHDLVIVGQKSGIIYSFNPDNGNVIWNLTLGPGGKAGGLIHGSASDGYVIYVNLANSENKNYTLFNGTVINYGSWDALNISNGKVLWQIPNPAKAMSRSPITLANGVVFVASADPLGYFYALHSQTVKILWSFPSGQSTFNGPSVVNGYIYWANSAGRLYAFALE